MMPVLPNPKHERFAQELAKGTTAGDAYVLAGFKPNRHNGATLARKQHIKARVSELLSEREQVHSQATAAAVESVGLTKAWVIGQLVENVSRAMQTVEVRDTRGQPTGEYRYEGSVANRGLELLGKELGMFVERKEVGSPGEFKRIDEMTADELREFVTTGIAPPSLRADETSNRGGSGAPGSKPH